MSRAGKRFIYIVTAPNGYIKIGTCGLPYERFSTLQNGSPLILTLAYVCECRDPGTVEAAVHLALKSERRHREWFETTIDIALAAIRTALNDSNETIKPLPCRMTSDNGIGRKHTIVSQVIETTI